MAISISITHGMEEQAESIADEVLEMAREAVQCYPMMNDFWIEETDISSDLELLRVIANIKVGSRQDKFFLHYVIEDGPVVKFRFLRLITAHARAPTKRPGNTKTISFKFKSQKP